MEVSYHPVSTSESYPSHGEGIWERQRAILVDIGVLIKYRCHDIMVCNRSRHAHRFPRLFYLVLAAIVMHGPGLYVKFEYEDLLEYSKSILAAAAEGICSYHVLIARIKSCWDVCKSSLMVVNTSLSITSI